MGVLAFFFLKLIVPCILCVIYVRKDNECNVMIGYDYTAIWTPTSAVSKRPLNSLTHFKFEAAPPQFNMRLHHFSKFPFHDDVIKWKHFPRYWPFVRGIPRSPVNSPHKGQWRGALMFSLICAWINMWVNNREAGDLRSHQAHYDVSVM